MSTPTLVSIQVGPPRSYGIEEASDPMDRLWTTGFFKEPVAGPVRVGWTNPEGDGQADLVNHGGPDKAVLAYSADHYPAWRSELDKPDLPFGAFGENFTVSDQTEEDVCIGDRWVLGEVRLEISQPRLPCWKVARRWRIKDLTARVASTGRSGWYFRVLSEGWVAASSVWLLEHRPFPEWTVARASRLWLHEKNSLADAAELAALPCLAMSWKEMLNQRLEKRHREDDSPRLAEPNAT